MICLQGGAEFGADGAAMDTDLVRAAAATGLDGPIVITALAGAPGREYDTANRNGVRYFTTLVDRAHAAERLGPTPGVIAAPDARVDANGAITLINSARMLVLPGGSPTRLLNALRDTGLDQAMANLLKRGGILMGASAGAMVLCERTWLPDSGGRIEDGLGFVPACLVLPHWSAGGLSRLPADGAGDDTTVLGLPEQSGVVIDAGAMTAVGHRASTIVRPATDPIELALGATAPAPSRPHLG